MSLKRESRNHTSKSSMFTVFLVYFSQLLTGRRKKTFHKKRRIACFRSLLLNQNDGLPWFFPQVHFLVMLYGTRFFGVSRTGVLHRKRHIDNADRLLHLGGRRLLLTEFFVVKSINLKVLFCFVGILKFFCSQNISWCGRRDSNPRSGHCDQIG